MLKNILIFMWIVSKQARQFWIPSRQRFESASGLMKRRLVNTVGESEDNDSSVLSIKKKANAFTTQRENTKLINQTVTNRFQVVLNRPPHIRDPLPPYIIPTSDDRNDYIKIISWNVNGFRALLRNQRGMLDQMITRHEPDIICLQETKVQNEVVESIEHVLPNYSSIWNCATTKKGYSGTVCKSKCNFAFLYIFVNRQYFLRIQHLGFRKYYLIHASLKL
jgi:hypothetical protein